MIVVSDTSPITALLQAGLDHLLAALFQRVIIPPAVRSELLRAHTSIPGWLEVVVPPVFPSAVRAARLDTGETEALALALELHADAILLDERLGRRAGTRMYSAGETDRMGESNPGSISAFAINRTDGQLTLLNTVNSGGAGPTHVSIHPSGRFLLVANYFGGSVSVLPILPDGSLGAAAP